jgi:thiamine-phosphate pyrophosphorylase
VKLPDPPLLLVTDRMQARMPLEALVASACAGGCRWVSVREKDLAPDEQIALVQRLKPIAQRFGARLMLHGDGTLAAAAGLDAVHLPATGDPAAARALLGPGALIGHSIHGTADATALDSALVDYAIAGPAFATASKPGYGPALGPNGLATICGAAPVPVIAIGGIDLETVLEVMRSGVAGIAVMGAVMRAAEPSVAIEHLLAALAAGRPASCATRAHA